ncbi:MAG: polyhydroxyalkanoic acid system family protein [Rhodanobacteraceae bacterium]
MPEIHIEYSHSRGKEGGRDAVDKLAHALSTRFGLRNMAWSGDTIGFAGRSVEGTVTVGETVASIHVRLGAVLGPLRPAIESEIRRQLRAHLG